MTSAAEATNAHEAQAQDAQGRPARCSAELSETSEGWHLTITLADAAAGAELLSVVGVGDHHPALGNFTMSVVPNLVPGHPFDIVEVRVLVAGKQPS